MDLQSNDFVSEEDAGGRSRPCENGGRDWSYASANHGLSRATRSLERQARSVLSRSVLDFGPLAFNSQGDALALHWDWTKGRPVFVVASTRSKAFISISKDNEEGEREAQWITSGTLPDSILPDSS